MVAISGMSQATFDYLIAFTKAHEGSTNFMYNNWPIKNSKKDVTIGVGISVQNENEAASPKIRNLFKLKSNGQTPSDTEMKKEFNRVNDAARTDGNLFSEFRDKSPMFIEPSIMNQKLLSFMVECWSGRGVTIANFSQIPAQAQVALASFNYGMRLVNARPGLLENIRNERYTAASSFALINGWDPQKNAAHMTLFSNADTLVTEGKDRTKLPPISGPFKPPPTEW